jgi:non-ribosomal peptide synthetase component F
VASRSQSAARHHSAFDSDLPEGKGAFSTPPICSRLRRSRDWANIWSACWRRSSPSRTRQLGELDLLGADERTLLLEGWNDTAADYPREQSLHALFAAQAARTPDATAVVFEDEVLSYAALDARSSQLAHHLRDLGVGPEVVVGLCLERSIQMVVALLAILKAGGAYLPLDPDYPAERLAFMLADAQAPVIVSQTSLADRLPDWGCATGLSR